ncbi:MAG: oligosaccharide flippase family protein [Rhodomicrobium sp.]|nr:oligosaccharide flippase family protein [Rhodomicrobium sp.]
MSSIRRAFFFASAERYIVILVNLAMMPVIARLMGPGDFGISVLGMAALAIAEVIRDFGSTAYIIHDRELTIARVRTAFTLTLVWTLALAALLISFSGPIARFYEVPGLELYLDVIAISYGIGPFVAPLFALLRREMAFDKIAIVTVTSTLVNAVAVIGLAASGFSYMSFAWANIISATLGMLLGFYFRPDFSIFRISFAEWRKLTNFASYQTGAHILLTLWENIPYLLFGRLLDVTAIGLYQRAISLCYFPKRAILGGLASIALPAFAASVRDGKDLKASYLRAVTLMTGVHWPALALLAILAHPIVAILLGERWQEVASLMPIIAVALMFNVSANLTFSVLIAAGAVRSTFYLYLIVVPIATAIVALAATYGLTAVAWSMFAIVPLEVIVALYFIRRALRFTLRELFLALLPSALLTLCAIVGPVAVLAANGWRFDLGFLAAACAAALAAAGWLLGLPLVKHALYAELTKALRFSARFRSKHERLAAAKT